MHLTLTCLAVWLLAPPAFSAPVASPAAPARMMKWADSTRLGSPMSKDPNVIEFGGRYLMYFSLPPFAPKLAPANAPAGWSIGIAESRDLFTWKKVGELWPEQECERRGLCTPSAIVLGGKVHLFYASYGNGRKDGICHAVSEDGLRFTRDPSNPVFHPTGGWTSGRAIDPEVFPVGDQLLLYFATRDPEMKIQMLGVAGADLKSDFGRQSWKQLRDAPILKPELPWERLCIEAPSLCRRGDELVMFYAGGYNNDPQQVGVAVSRDGLKWERCGKEPFLRNGQPGEWNFSESGHPGVFTGRDGQTWLFFQGNNDRGATWFLSRAAVGWSGNRPKALTAEDFR
jgi:predicted GH43/DUF377 family glycosyl hydrolase